MLNPSIQLRKKGNSKSFPLCRRIHFNQKATYSTRSPFKHNVPPARPPIATAISRSIDFEVDHRRTRSADQPYDSKISLLSSPIINYLFLH